MLSIRLIFIGGMIFCWFAVSHAMLEAQKKVSTKLVWNDEVEEQYQAPEIKNEIKPGFLTPPVNKNDTIVERLLRKYEQKESLIFEEGPLQTIANIKQNFGLTNVNDEKMLIMTICNSLNRVKANKFEIVLKLEEEVEKIKKTSGTVDIAVINQTHIIISTKRNWRRNTRYWVFFARRL